MAQCAVNARMDLSGRVSRAAPLDRAPCGSTGSGSDEAAGKRVQVARTWPVLHTQIHDGSTVITYAPLPRIAKLVDGSSALTGDAQVS